MQCPYCQTENREDRERCYACDKDISMLRLLVNKARHHYNDALEHAERGRTTEAIDELRNALDLDRRFTNAHVVLGTLYAKDSQYEKARECWDNALKLSPELEKAHSYLGRVHTVEHSLPALKSYRWISIALLLLVLGLIAGLLVALRPDPAVPRLREARQLYQQQKYGKALKELDAVRRNSDPGSAVNLAADSLRLALKTELSQQVRNIQGLKFGNHYKEAISAITALEASQPDNETSSKLALLRQDIAHYYQQDIDKLYEDFQYGRTDYDTLKEKIGEYLELYPAGPERVYFRDYLNKAGELQAGREIEQLRKDFAATHNYLETRRRLSALVAKFPDSRQLAAGRTDLVDEILSWMFEQFHQLVDDRQYADAEELLDDIADSIDEFKDVVDVSGPVDLARRVLSDARWNSRLKDIEELIRAGKLEDADYALFLLEAQPDLTPAEQDVLTGMQERIREHGQRRSHEQQKQMLQQLLSVELSNEEASSTLATLEDQLSSGAIVHKPELLAKGAAAAAKLEKRDTLTSIVARLREAGHPEVANRAEKLLPEPTPKPGKPARGGRNVPNEIRIEPSTGSGSSPSRQEPASVPAARRNRG